MLFVFDPTNLERFQGRVTDLQQSYSFDRFVGHVTEITESTKQIPTIARVDNTGMVGQQQRSLGNGGPWKREETTCPSIIDHFAFHMMVDHDGAFVGIGPEFLRDEKVEPRIGIRISVYMGVVFLDMFFVFFDQFRHVTVYIQV